MTADAPVDFSQWIPVFPLPNAVMLPRAVLPLHVFEERYRLMTRDALAGSGVIAIALLQPGFEPLYHSKEAPIHRVAGVGRILREERLPDGRYNLLLQGTHRAKVVWEDTQRAYRRAILQPIGTPDLDPQTECRLRSRLRSLLGEGPLSKITSPIRLADLLSCPDMTFSNIVDALSAVVLQTPEEKQNMLAEPCAARRARHLMDALTGLTTVLQQQALHPHKARSWPPTYCDN